VDREGYREQIRIPKAGQSVIETAIGSAVENGHLWLRSEPASILAEPIPAGVLNPDSILSAPPDPIGAPEVLPETLPAAWKEGVASGLSIATALSTKAGKTLPWRTVRDAIDGAVRAQFVEIVESADKWPCDFPLAQAVTFKMVTGKRPGGEPPTPPSNILFAEAELSPDQVQDLADVLPKLLEIKAKTGVPIRFTVCIEVGDGKTKPPDNATADINTVLGNIAEEYQLRKK
jgi:hypothetical protein